MCTNKKKGGEALTGISAHSLGSMQVIGFLVLSVIVN